MAKLKYGSIGPNEPHNALMGKLKTSTVLVAKSGRFLTWDISDGSAASAGWRAPATDENAITGYTEHVTAASASGDKVTVFTGLDGVTFELPYAASGAAATLTDTLGSKLIGQNCDVYVDGDGIQYANTGSTTDGLFLVVGYDVANNLLHVQVKNAKQNVVS